MQPVKNENVEDRIERRRKDIQIALGVGNSFPDVFREDSEQAPSSVEEFIENAYFLIGDLKTQVEEGFHKLAVAQFLEGFKSIEDDKHFFIVDLICSFSESEMKEMDSNLISLKVQIESNDIFFIQATKKEKKEY